MSHCGALHSRHLFLPARAARATRIAPWATRATGAALPALATTVIAVATTAIAVAAATVAVATVVARLALDGGHRSRSRSRLGDLSGAACADQLAHGAPTTGRLTLVRA
jgi:dolichyl-phosphate-mannose--protein O-mannosyl transferase